MMFVPTAWAQAGVAVGGASSTGASNIPGLVLNIYNLALLFGGLLAFVMILYAAVKYTLQGGNPSAQSDAKDQITQAILGLALLLGAYVVLNTINPELTRLKLPTVRKVEAPKGAQVNASTTPLFGCVAQNSRYACSFRADCSDTTCGGLSPCTPIVASSCGNPAPPNQGPATSTVRSSGCRTTGSSSTFQCFASPGCAGTCLSTSPCQNFTETNCGQ